jgi:pimeloyl-ACP methyl ester carboxylesterase
MYAQYAAGDFEGALKSIGRDFYFFLTAQKQRPATLLLHHAFTLAGAAVLRSRVPANRDLAKLLLIASALPGFGGTRDCLKPNTSLAMMFCSYREAGLVRLFVEILSRNPYFDNRTTRQLLCRVRKSRGKRSLLRALKAR